MTSSGLSKDVTTRMLRVDVGVIAVVATAHFVPATVSGRQHHLLDVAQLETIPLDVIVPQVPVRGYEVGVRDLHDRLSEHLDRVQAGRVTDQRR